MKVDYSLLRFAKLINLGKFARIENFMPLLVLLISINAALPALNKRQVKTIVIDAGHGGHDPGCQYGGVKEKEVTLKIALELGKKLSEELSDVKVIFTRKSDEFVTLWDRANIANRNQADLFISIHCNANKNTAVSGTETFAMGLHKAESNLDVSIRENDVILMEKNYEERYEGFDPNSPETHIILSLHQNAYLDKSIDLASRIEKYFVKNKVNTSRGVKQAGFVVLWKTKMPSILIETGFLSNKNDRKLLTSEEGVDKITENITNSLVDFKQSIENVQVKNNID
ncbi:MAG: N-acetylmuramoyl-L-alanine amidase family protein [Bacteroidia bacterium]